MCGEGRNFNLLCLKAMVFNLFFLEIIYKVIFKTCHVDSILIIDCVLLYINIVLYKYIDVHKFYVLDYFKF
jgi:hypothetical protein